VLFNCKRSGKCCTHPNIVVTLTHEDIWVLYQRAQDIEELKKVLQFLITESNHSEEQMVLSGIKTTSGIGNFILRKNNDKKCVFYENETSSCQIHTFRPAACRNFPFSFAQDNEKTLVSWVKGAQSFCPGIGSGIEYKMEELENIGRNSIAVIKEYNNIAKEISKEDEITPHEALLTLLMVADKHKDKIQSDFQIL
jgi:Fe-S-cluster containining protein